MLGNISFWVQSFAVGIPLGSIFSKTKPFRDVPVKTEKADTLFPDLYDTIQTLSRDVQVHQIKNPSFQSYCANTYSDIYLDQEFYTVNPAAARAVLLGRIKYISDKAQTKALAASAIGSCIASLMEITGTLLSPYGIAAPITGYCAYRAMSQDFEEAADVFVIAHATDEELLAYGHLFKACIQVNKETAASSPCSSFPLTKEGNIRWIVAGSSGCFTERVTLIQEALKKRNVAPDNQETTKVKELAAYLRSVAKIPKTKIPAQINRPAAAPPPPAAKPKRTTINTVRVR